MKIGITAAKYQNIIVNPAYIVDLHGPLP